MALHSGHQLYSCNVDQSTHCGGLV